jgi:uncharacterized protein (TIGR02677 family)
MADNAPLYRAILDVFAASKRQFRLHLRPDEVLAEAAWPSGPPTLEAVQQALGQLVEWGNLQSQPDTARVATIEDFYRKRLLYRMTSGGEAVEAGLQAFVEALARRAELQSVALDDIRARLISLGQLMRESPPDTAKVHGALRDLVHVFEGLSDNAEAFMAGLARTIELQRAEIAAVMSFKTRLIDYLQRFIGDLVTRSSQIAELLIDLRPFERPLLQIAAERDARNAAPGDFEMDAEAVGTRLIAWNERWAGLARWFVSDGRDRAQAELLRASALSAIPRLLQAVSLLHERRAGRSDRAADFRRLALWFAAAGSHANAHRLWRAAFALSPARHLALAVAGHRRPAEASRTRRAADPRRSAPNRGPLCGARVTRGPRCGGSRPNRIGTTTPGHQPGDLPFRVGFPRCLGVSSVPGSAGRGTRGPDGSRRARGTIDRRRYAHRAPRPSRFSRPSRNHDRPGPLPRPRPSHPHS